jgi:hypothetical protein
MRQHGSEASVIGVSRPYGTEFNDTIHTRRFNAGLLSGVLRTLSSAIFTSASYQTFFFT